MTAPLPDPSLPWPIIRPGVALLCDLEKCILRAFKPLPTDPWTVGWGATGDGIGPNTAWTQPFADQDLCNRLITLVGQVRDGCALEPNENELAAMVVMAYNIGIGWDDTKPKPKGAKDGWRQSSVRRLHNQGDHQGAARAFDLWNMSAGQVIKGLTARRKREAALYLTPPAGAEKHAMPQDVTPEAPMRTKPTVTAAGGAAVVAAGKAASDLADSIKDAGDWVSAVKPPLDAIKGFAVDFLGPLAPHAPLLLIVGLCGVVIWQRVQARRNGWG